MMNYQRMWSFAVASVLTLSSAAVAQQQVEKITFQQAIEIALKQNLTIRQAEANLESAEIGARLQGLSLIPDLRFSVGAGNSFGRVFDPGSGTLTNKNTQSTQTSVQTGMTLWDAGRTRNNVRSSRIDADATEADLFRTRQTTVYNVALGFIAYVNAQSQLDVQKENLAALQLQEAQVQRFADAGARPVADLYNIKSQVASTQLAVTRAESDIETAKFNLMQTLQLDPAKDYDFVAPQIPETIAVTNYNLDSLVKLAYTRRRDVVAAESRVLAANYDVRVAKAGYMPNIGIGGNYGTNGRFGQTTTISDQLDQNRGGGVSLSVSMPIFDRSQTSLNKRRAQIQEQNLQLALNATRQTVALDVRKAWYAVRNSEQQLVAAQAGLVASTQALEAITQRYNVGAATLLEVTQARAQRVTAQSNLASARYQLVLNQAAMQYFTGELDPATLRVGR
jgi:outer membrane protein